MTDGRHRPDVLKQVHSDANEVPVWPFWTGRNAP